MGVGTHDGELGPATTAATATTATTSSSPFRRNCSLTPSATSTASAIFKPASLKLFARNAFDTLPPSITLPVLSNDRYDEHISPYTSFTSSSASPYPSVWRRSTSTSPASVPQHSSSASGSTNDHSSATEEDEGADTIDVLVSNC